MNLLILFFLSVENIESLYGKQGQRKQKERR